jgi:hypothetical protein
LLLKMIREPSSLPWSEKTGAPVALRSDYQPSRSAQRLDPDLALMVIRQREHAGQADVMKGSDHLPS